MQRPIYIFHLFDAEMYPLYIDANGDVQRGNKETLLQQDGVTPCRLQHAPEDWQNTQIKYSRSIKTWGMIREVVFAVKFIADGAQIVRHFKWTYGSEIAQYISISKLDLLSHPDNYKTILVSELNLAKYKQSRGMVTVDLLDGGMNKYYKAYQDTTYEIPIDDSETFVVNMDGMNFNFSRTFSATPNQLLYAVPNYYLGQVETAREGNAPDVLFQDILPKQSNPYPNEDWFVRNDLPGSLSIRRHGKVKLQFNETDTIILRVEVNDGVNLSSTQYDLVNLVGTPRTAGTIEEFSYDVTFPVPASSRAHMKIFTGSNTGSLLQVTVLEGEDTCEYLYRYKQSYVKCIYLYRLLQKLVDKMTDGKYTCSSTWLNSFKDLAVTCGDGLRNLPASVIKTSLTDLFKSLNTKDFNRNGAGLAIKNDVLIVERLADFFKSNIGIELGDISNLEVTNAEDLMFNTIKTGYPKQEYKDVNGKYETNQSQQWTTPKKKDVKELDIVSPYRADPLGIELTRINFEGKKTTDGSSDNDTFLLHIETTVAGTVVIDTISYNIFNLYRPPYSSVTGLPNWETSFNNELSPKHSILNTGGFIHSILDLLDIELIKFQSADKNKDLSTTLAGVTVTQKEDIVISSLAPKLFRPYYFTFKTRVPITLPEILSVDPYSKVSFKYNDITYYGYLMDGAIQPADNEAQSWKLLCAANTDISKLIKNFN